MEAGAEFLAAKKILYAETGDIAPASVTKLLAAKRSQPPSATIFAAPPVIVQRPTAHPLVEGLGFRALGLGL